MKMQIITCYTVTDLLYSVLLRMLFEINKLNLIGIPILIYYYSELKPLAVI